jgi:hypothetical protein
MCTLKTFPFCSSSLFWWSLESGSATYWTSSLCGSNSSHSVNRSGDVITISSSVKHAPGTILGQAEIWKTTYSGSFTGSCVKSASFVVGGTVSSSYNRWSINGICGTSSSNCSDTSITTKYTKH